MADKDSQKPTAILPVAPTKRLTQVTMVKDMNVFGAHGTQLSDQMVGISLAWDGLKVVVTREQDGREFWIMPGAIACLVWK